MGLSQRVLGQLPSRKTAPRIIAPWIIAPWMIAFPGELPPGQLPPRIIARGRIAPRTIAPEENCLPGKLPPHHKLSPENSCPHSSNFPSKSTTSELRKAMDCRRVL